MDEPRQGSGAVRVKIQYAPWGLEELAQIGQEAQAIGERVSALEQRVRYLLSAEGLARLLTSVRVD